MFIGWEVDDRIRGSPISTLELSGATARLSHQPFTHTFTQLAKAVRIRGLQGRRRGFYVMIFAVLVLALAGSATGMILLDDSWLQLLLAGALGVIFTQFAFLGHEASHRQIFESGRANDRSGRVLAYWWASATAGG
jgi:fatty acid desaturase